MGRYIHILLLLATMTISLVSCKDDMYDNSPGGPLELSSATIKVGNEGEVVYVGVTARDGAWEMTGDEEWCTVSPTSGEKGISRITVTFSPNDAKEAVARTATFTFTSGSAEKTIAVEQLAEAIGPPNRNAEYDINDSIHKLLNIWYYNGETKGASADYNQSTVNFFDRYLLSLSRNTLDGNKWSRNQERYLYSRLTKTPLEEVTGLAPLSYGMEFDLNDYYITSFSRNGLVARILYVEEDSPAQRAQLKRGDWFYKVTDAQLGNWETNDKWWYYYNRQIDSLVHPVAGFSPRLGTLNFISHAGQLTDAGGQVTLTPVSFSGSPILHTQLIEEEDVAGNETRTGYLVFNSFDPEYENQLVGVFADNFAGKDLTHFILDLRYSKSGTVEMAELMGNLLVPNGTGDLFAKYEFASGEAAEHKREVKFTPHTSGAKVDKIFILTSRNTAGPAELLINALRGVSGVELVLVGDVTEGMNVGMVHRHITSETHRYDMWISAFRCYNASGQGDYQYGFVPNGGEINEWNNDVSKYWSATWGWKGVQGLEEDRLLERAMDFVRGRVEMPTSPILEAASRQRSGYPRQFSVPPGMVMEIEEEEVKVEEK